tara:strand:- start:2471 stop:3703 length:1233 start_codon:yes stop_codon:yes gene_type:complete
MKVLRRKILLDDLKRFDDGVAYDTITATSIYIKVEMTQTIDDLGMVTNLPFIPNVAECAKFDGSIIVTNVTCYDPNSLAPSSASVNVTVYGGQAPYTYNFYVGTIPIFNVTTNNTNYILQNLAAGSYSVEVVDSLGCVVELAGISENLSDVVTPTGYVILSEPYGTYPANVQIPFSNITGTISVCGTVDITMGINNPGDYTDILWSTNETTDTIQVTQNGTYNVSASNGDCFGATPEVNIEFYSLDLSELDNLIIEPTTLNYWNGQYTEVGISGSGLPSAPYILPCIPQPVTTTPPFKVQLQGTGNPLDLCQNVNWHVQHKQASEFQSYVGFDTPFVFGTPQNLIVDPYNEGDVLDPNPCPPESPCSIQLKVMKCGCGSTTFDFESNEIWVVYNQSETCVALGVGSGGGN